MTTTAHPNLRAGQRDHGRLSSPACGASRGQFPGYATDPADPGLAMSEKAAQMLARPVPWC